MGLSFDAHVCGYLGPWMDRFSMHDQDLLLTLVGGLGAALLCGYAASKVGISPIVGYLFAGIAVGSKTPGFQANPEIAGELAERAVWRGPRLGGTGVLHFGLSSVRVAVRRFGRCSGRHAPAPTPRPSRLPCH